MHFPWLKPIFTSDPPFLSLYFDATRTDPGVAEIERRWDHLRTQATQAGAPAALLGAIEDSALAPSGIGGPHGRAFLATGEGLLIDRVLPTPPHADAVAWQERPMLLPLMRVASCAVSQLLVEVDRSGADFSLRAPDDPRLTGSPEGLGEESSVDGGHDELHKPRTGWKGHRFEARVEDSWERNAAAVAATLDKLVRQHRPDVVVLTGDVRAAHLLMEAVGQETRARLIEVPGGARGSGADRGAFHVKMRAALDDFAAARSRATVERLRAERAAGRQAVTGADQVAEALERGQVGELILAEGEEPANVEELLYRAVLTEAGIQTVPPGSAALVDGVGALLRWRDESTPSDGVSSLSSDPRREHQLNGG